MKCYRYERVQVNHIFQRGWGAGKDNFYDFLFASLGNDMGLKKNLSLEEQIFY